MKQGQSPVTNLQEAITLLVGKGYRVVSQTSTTAQLVSPKTFSRGWMLFWTLCSFGTIFWLYPLYYLTKRDKQIYLEQLPSEYAFKKDGAWYSADGLQRWDGERWVSAMAAE